MPSEPVPSFPAGDRRQFLLSSAGLSAAGIAAMSQQSVAATPATTSPSIQPGDTVLFQGDSITDAGRNRDQPSPANEHEAFGNGYAWIAASSLLVRRPADDLKFFNRGISGNKVFQLADRWQEDTLALKPDLLSVLIGVNDIWHTLEGRYEGTVDKYEADYQQLLARTREALPHVKLVVREPFVLKCGVVNETWFPEFDKYREAARQVAVDAQAQFVPFQEMFDRAVEFAEPEHWAKDGVHPTPFGAALMAHAWLEAVGA